MINPFKEINWTPDRQDIRSFGRTLLVGALVISGLFLLIGIFRKPFTEAMVFPIWLTAISFIIFIVSLIAPKLALPFYYLWFGISACIGLVVSNLLLCAFFYLFFSTFAVIFRKLTGRDPLCLRKDCASATYWCNHDGPDSIKSYFRQY